MDEDLFDDDDGLDDLPSNTLQEIESRAFQATQRPAVVDSNQHEPPSSNYGLEEDEEVIDLNAKPQNNVITAHQTNPAAGRRYPPLSQASQPARPPDEPTQREQWRQNRYGPAAQQRLPAFKPPRPTSASGDAVPIRLSQQPPSQRPVTPGLDRGPPAAPQPALNGNATTSDMAALQQRIAELEQQQATVRQESQDAQARAFAKAGEISIIRANQDKTVKEYEEKLYGLQELHAQEVAKHKADMEAARKDREKMETSNKFLEHDLAQEANRARNAKRALKGGNENNRNRPSPASTPKKKKSYVPFRDGFNDDEVIAISPSRSRDKSRPTSPKAASKRKRPDDADSPAKQLSFSEHDSPMSVGQAAPSAHTSFELPERPREEQEPGKSSELVQLVLNHRQPDNSRTVELLTKYTLPSAPGFCLSSHVYDALQIRRDNEDAARHTLHFIQKALDLWTRCLTEQVIEAIPLIMSLVQDILMDVDEKICAAVISQATPLAVQTADLVATPKARAWSNPTASTGPSAHIEAVIRPLECLELLQTLAMNSSDVPDAMQTLWSCIEHDFILVMLHKAQSLAESILMLDIVGMSVLPDTFGAILKAPSSDDEYATKQRQHQNEYNLASRLSNLLVDRRDQQRPEVAPSEDAQDDVSFDPPQEDPAAASSEESDTDDETQLQSRYTIFDLHLAALGLLKHLCSTEHGGKLLAGHRSATGRLIRLLHESILSMYSYSPSTHELSVACVNQSVMLLAHLSFVHGDTLDLRARLAVEPGGHHKHLVALSRVAFSTGESMIEDGIWSESAEAAHRMLDEFLSPEEGDAVVNVFSSLRSAG